MTLIFKSFMASSSVIPSKSGLFLTLSLKLSSSSPSSSHRLSTKTRPTGCFFLALHASFILSLRFLVLLVASNTATLSWTPAQSSTSPSLVMGSSSHLNMSVRARLRA